MWHVVIDFKDCTLTFNTGFHAKAVDDQVSLHRELTFRHWKQVFRVALIIVLMAIMGTASFMVYWLLMQWVEAALAASIPPGIYLWVYF
jgi:hypothetical protein